jgi:dephospho-CoA kinase
VDPDPSWPAQASRLGSRIAAAAGEKGLGVTHVGPTAVPGLPAEDVIDLQLAVASVENAETVADALAEAGFPACVPITQDDSRRTCRHASADPGRPALLHVRVHDSPGWRQALLVRDWLCADAAGRAEFLDAWRTASAELGGEDASRCAGRTETWFETVLPSAERWAKETGWSPDDSADEPDH